ncbi:pentapeptide repeat-containing protein [Aquibacillus kalidii]|uniref:pentapeptide repeat-containing protein n=1 Tax=Aquibacillus kalidii TaxID=2762597 RepID=UPI001644350C|nr:pentapeptide repeat-containing protein [Aquibacillus kalidii]
MGLDMKKCDLQKVDISGSKWEEVNAEELIIDNVSLAKTTINNVNMSNMLLSDVNMSGVKIQHANFTHAVIDHVHLYGTEFRSVVFPLEGEGNFDPKGKYKPISFDNCDLTNGIMKNCNLSGLDILDCNITGLKINGVLVEDLLKNSKV